MNLFREAAGFSFFIDYSKLVFRLSLCFGRDWRGALYGFFFFDGQSVLIIIENV